jgi:hypothetical protein
MKANWNIFFKEKTHAIILCLSLLALLITLFAFLHFLTFNENRIGFMFNDPILNLFKPMNISTVTFFVIYSFSLIGFLIAIRSPTVFIKLLQAYTIMILLKMLCMYLIPLEPPTDIIPLHDVLLKSSLYSGRDNLKDLFYSGHTATIFLFAIGFTNKKLKWFFTVGAILVGALVLLQHVHYSIDVIAAPVFIYIAFFIQKKINFH